ncbi:MAG: phosphoadenylyl-sulfate reductase [Caldilineaceae bacterium]|nr:phosphoadenylyl-sulfate reductase [Caldilineaceae bacterium]
MNQEFETATPQTILQWAWKTFPSDMAATSSFQTQSMPLLHMISLVAPDLPIFFLDTTFHFPETLFFRDRLMREWGLNVRSLTAEQRLAHSQDNYGQLYRTDPDRCCYINKVAPLARAKEGLAAWITGIRRDQTEARRHTPIVSRDKNGQVKICPMATWTEQDVWRYINQHDLPVHPLLSQGYMSIGCAPCTRPVHAGEESRSGRWADRAKTECGLHVELPVEDERQDETLEGKPLDG